MENTLVRQRIYSPLAMLLVAALLTGLMNLPAFLNRANALSIDQMSDTVSTSIRSLPAVHTVKWVTSSTYPAAASSTITLVYSNAFNSSTTPFSTAAPTDFTMATSTNATSSLASFASVSVVAKGACTGAAESATVPRFEISSTTNTTGGPGFIFTHCNGSGAISTSTALRIVIGAGATARLINPDDGEAAHSFSIVAPPGDDSSGFIWIMDSVTTMTASVGSTVSFTVTGVSSGGTCNNGDTATITTTSTTIPWGAIPVNSTLVACQELAMTSNGANGFRVTVHQDGNLRVAGGATTTDIDAFKDGNGQYTPIAFTPPAPLIGDQKTWGHIGLSSNDSNLVADTLDSNNDFTGGKYAAIGTSTPRLVFASTGPGDGTTHDTGKARVTYKVNISSFQQASTLYTNQLTYVATVIF
jgi:hypothetical protein